MKRILWFTLFLASISITADEQPSYTINRDNLYTFVREAWQLVSSDVLSNDAYWDIIIKEQMNDEDIDKINSLFVETFNVAWPELASQLKDQPPITPMSDETINRFKSRLLQASTDIFIEKMAREIMQTCECIPTPDRISYTLIVAQAIEKQFNPDNPIVMTAFASGLLLQEYLLLSHLKSLGFKNISLNIVDLGYPDPVILQRILRRMNTSDIHQALQHYVQEALLAAHTEGEDTQAKQEWLQENKQLFPELKQLIGGESFDTSYAYQKALNLFKQLLPEVQLQVYQNMHDYTSRVAQNPSLKADVLTLVDPNIGIFDIAPFPSEANMVGITNRELYKQQEPPYKPHALITLKQDKPIQIYVHADSYQKAKKDDKQFADDIEQLVQTSKATGADQGYNDTFRNWIFKTFGQSFNTAQLKNLIKKNEQQLNNRNQLNNQQLNTILDELQAAHQTILDYKGQIETLARINAANVHKQGSEESKVLFAKSIIEQLKTLLDTLPEQAYELTWFSDPHLAFQELVGKTAKENALIFLYYQDDPDMLHMERPFILEQVSKEKYLQRDVFGPNVGRMLVQTGIGQEEEGDDEDTFDLSDFIEQDMLDEHDHEDDFDTEQADDTLQDDPHDRYGRIDLDTGTLLSWDDLKGTFQSHDEKRVPAMPEEDYDFSDVQESDSATASSSDSDENLQPLY